MAESRKSRNMNDGHLKTQEECAKNQEEKGKGFKQSRLA